MINIIKGDTITFECSLVENITDWKIRCEIYDVSSNSIKKATANSGGADNQIEITKAIEGEFDIKINAGDTTNFDDKAKIEIEVETPTGKIYTVYQGDIELEVEQITWVEPS